MAKKIYSHELDKRVNDLIPFSIIRAMSEHGWNAIGIYELVAEEIRREKRELKAKLKSQGHTT